MTINISLLCWIIKICVTFSVCSLHAALPASLLTANELLELKRHEVCHLGLRILCRYILCVPCFKEIIPKFLIFMARYGNRRDTA
jgi:hypothetical protein